MSTTFWDRVRQLEGVTLATLHQDKPFVVVAVDDDYAHVMPHDGNGQEQLVRRDRIEHIANLGLQRDELRRCAQKEYANSQNTSYIAALAFEAAKLQPEQEAEITPERARVCKIDWQTKELPSKRITISLNRSFSSHEIHRMRMGLLPVEMEDKWFIYWENDTLYFHRSWTGFCIYIVRFTTQCGCYRMVEADVNRDLEQYSETSVERDAKMISYLVDVLLLQREADFPSEDSSFEKQTLMQWSQVGRAMLGQHPNQA